MFNKLFSFSLLFKVISELSAIGSKDYHNAMIRYLNKTVV